MKYTQGRQEYPQTRGNRITSQSMRHRVLGIWRRLLRFFRRRRRPEKNNVLAQLKLYMPYLILFLFWVSLFGGIYSHIDGLGILAIISGIIFSLYLIYFKAKDSGGNELDRIKLALSIFLSSFNGTTKWQLIRSCIYTILEFIMKHKNSLNESKLELLKDNIRNMLKAFENDRLENKPDPEPEPHKPVKRSHGGSVR